MTLDGRAALEEYLRLVVPGRMLLKAVFASRLYQFFVQAAPGSARTDDARQGLLRSRSSTATSHRLGAIIVVDAPASGQAMSLLKMPTAARSTFGDSIVGKEASNISRDAARPAQLRDRPGHDRRQSFDFRNNRDSRAVEQYPSRAGRRAFQSDAAVRVRRRRHLGADKSPRPHIRKKDLDHLAELAKSELNSRGGSAQGNRKNPHGDRRPGARDSRAQRPVGNRADRFNRDRPRPPSRR